MSYVLAHREVDGEADEGVRNSQPEGIGRVVGLGDLVCWNNLGRNVVFADPAFRPHAVFGTTLFPDQDEPSQYDLDVHSILDIPEFGLVAVLNHFGTVRAFRRHDLVSCSEGQLVVPTAEWSFVADVERTVAVAGRLIGSAPRSDRARGLVVSEFLDIGSNRSNILRGPEAAGLGEVTALGVVRRGAHPFVAVGGDGKIAMVPFTAGQIGRPHWESAVGFRAAMIVWHDGAIWVAGPEGGEQIDDYDWERLGGGGFAVLDPADGTTITSGRLPDDVAWGTGGVAVAPFGSWLAAAGRSGSLHLVDPRSGATRSSSTPLATGSLGIAHLAVVGQQLVCGFNRGGYRLHCFTDSADASDGRYSLKDS